MAEEGVTLLCYWNGKITNGPRGISYEGAMPTTIRVNSKITYNELYDKMFEVTGFNRNQFELKIICRFPGHMEYIAVPVDSGDFMVTMVEVAEKHSCVELYIQEVSNIDDNITVIDNPVNLDAIPQMVALEGYTCVAEGMDINNNLVVDGEDEAYEVLLPNDDIMQYEEAPAQEFTNVDWANEAIVSDWVPWNQVVQQSEDGEFYIGQVFKSKNELQNAMKAYSVRRHHQYVVVDSSKKLLVLLCKQKNQCQWRLRAIHKSATGQWEIRKYNGPHTCSNPIINQDHLQLDSGFIAGQIRHLVKAQISITVAVIKTEIEEKFNYKISYKKAWHAKQKAIEQIFGGWEESYNILPKYLAEVKAQNNGTVVHFHTRPGMRPREEIFERVFWAFGPSIEGFKYCRPVISIDGTHLYGKYRGTMLIAVGADANNQLFPLAFAIVENENNSSWSWFMACIRRWVVLDRRELCVISDRHAGILTTMNTPGSKWDEPYAYHRICMRHLASNFNTRYRDNTLKDLICKAAREHQVGRFDEVMERIKNINIEAWEKLKEIDVRKWALAHDGGRRYGIMTTNLSEIFNSVLKGGRSLPITALVQLTFYRVNSYFAHRLQLAEERAEFGANFTPYIDAKLIANGAKASACAVIGFNFRTGYYEVQTAPVIGRRNTGGHTHRVHLEDIACTCQKVQLYGIPCAHVIAACQQRSIDYRSFVKMWYALTTYKSTWAPIFHPIRDKEIWLVDDGLIMKPCESMKRSKKGRPKSTRLRNEMDVREGSSSATCGICKQKGHNRRTCPNKNQLPT